MIESKAKFFDLKHRIYEELVENKLAELEDRSHRCNVRIAEIKKSSNVTWEKWEEHLGKGKIDEEKNTVIERAPRAKSPPEGKRSKPGTIFCTFHDYKGKVKILQNAKKLKRINICINKSFSQKTLAYKKQLWKEVKQQRSEDKTDCLNYSTVFFLREE